MSSSYHKKMQNRKYNQTRRGVHMYIYQRIKDMREDTDRTQAEVSEYLGILQPQYQRYESGKREIPLHIMIQLAELYQVSMDYMCGRTNIQENPNL